MINKKKILAITLARGGSKSIPKKNIKIFDGIPLIAHTIKAVNKSKFIDRYIVSSDNDEIINIAKSYNAEVPFVRPSIYSSDKASSVSALQHAVEWAEKDSGEKYDYIVEVMCTNPLKITSDIDACIIKLEENKADSVIAVHKLEDHHPARIKKIEDGKLVDFCVPEIPEMRRQDLKPEAYIRSGAIYALKRDHLMIEARRYGSKNSFAYVLPPERSINIDHEYDFIVAEQILKKIDREKNV
mgnify:CR=1 FL=1